MCLNKKNLHRDSDLLQREYLKTEIKCKMIQIRTFFFFQYSKTRSLRYFIQRTRYIKKGASNECGNLQISESNHLGW